MKLTGPFNLADALGRVSRPDPASATTGEKRQYSDDLSRVFSESLEQAMQTHFPNTFSGGGTGTNAATAAGIKSIDVAFNIEGLFLGLGLTVKVVGLPEGTRGYTHNYKRVAEEWTLETVNYHRYMPYSIIVGMLFLPSDCMTDRPQVSSLSAAVSYFGPHRGRRDHRDDPDLLEEIYVGVYEAQGAQSGEVWFVSAEHELAPTEIPARPVLMSFEKLKDELVVRFKARNRKLKVHGMP